MFRSKRSTLLNSTLFISAFTLCLTQYAAAEVTVQPKSGQSGDQIEKAKSDCYQKAKDTTGFDPKAASASNQPKGGAGKGAAKGAAVGAVGGAMGGSAGTGAAVGAGVGAAAGHHKKKKAEQAQEQQNEQNKSELAAFDRAESSCLESKGYAVSTG